MIVIRLSRVGKKKQPTYRIVVQEKQRDPWGTSIEIVGLYNPRTKPKTLELKKDRIEYWLSQGAQPTETVHNLLVDEKMIDAPKRRATTKDKKQAEETPEEGAEAPGEEKPAEEPKPEEEKKEEAPTEDTPAEEPKEEAAS